MTPTATEELLTVPQVMARLHLGRSTVYDLIRTRQLPSITIGRARRIHPEALHTFLNTRKEDAA